MNVALRTVWTLERFLEWEERQECKHEFDGVRPVAMAGVSEAHAEIQANLIREIGNLLNRPPCRIVGSDLQIQVVGRIRYPDAMITCAPRALGRGIAVDPVVLFEILSESTADTDLVDKNEEYRATESVQRYVILHQTRAAAEVFARRGEDWISEIVTGADAVLRLPEVGVDVPLAAIYRDVALPVAADPTATESPASAP